MPATTTSTAKEAVMPTATALVCSTCGRAPEAPYRRIVAGVVAEGCVSAAHDAHPDAWHLRSEAAALRAYPHAWADLVPA